MQSMSHKLPAPLAAAISLFIPTLRQTYCYFTTRREGGGAKQSHINEHIFSHRKHYFLQGSIWLIREQKQESVTWLGFPLPCLTSA